MTTRLHNVSNPAAFGIEWTHGDSGNTFQLVNARGTSGLMFGMRASGRGEWSTMRVVNPERFGMTRPPRTFAEFRAIAERYIGAE
jgi:hypothetical protein